MYRTALKVVPASDSRYISLEAFLETQTALTRALPDPVPAPTPFVHVLCDSSWTMFHNSLREKGSLHGYLRSSTPSSLAAAVAECVTLVEDGSDDDKSD
jgi:hypothetical protein